MTSEKSGVLMGEMGLLEDVFRDGSLTEGLVAGSSVGDATAVHPAKATIKGIQITSRYIFKGVSF